MATQQKSDDQSAVTNRAVDRVPGVIRPLLENDRLRFYLELVPWAAFLVAFAFLPLLAIVVWSFGTSTMFSVKLGFNPGNYVKFFTSYRFGVFIDTLIAAVIQVVVALVVGFPIAYYAGILKRDSKYTFPLLLLFAIPFLTNYILRTLSWVAFLGREGVVNTVLISLGVIEQPLGWLLYSHFAVHVSLIASYVPFMIFPVWLAMNRIDDDVLRASADLGASPLKTLQHVIIPLSLPGIVIGAMFVFVGVLGESVVSNLLGGGSVTYISSIISNSVDSFALPLASAMSTVILVLALVILFIWEKTFGLKIIGEI